MDINIFTNYDFQGVNSVNNTFDVTIEPLVSESQYPTTTPTSSVFEWLKHLNTNINVGTGSVTTISQSIQDYVNVSQSNASNIATDLLMSSSLYNVSASNDTDIRNLTTLSQSIQDYYNVSQSVYNITGSSTTPGGLNTYVQYNSASTFAGAAGLRYNETLNSLAEGSATIATGMNSHAEGSGSRATGDWAHAEGEYTLASGIEGPHAEGFYTIASGPSAHAEGEYTLASALDSHAEGNHSKAVGQGSHAQNYFTIASGSYSHAEGTNTIADAPYSHVEGQSNIVAGWNSHVEGKDNIIGGIPSSEITSRCHVAGNMNSIGYRSNITGYAGALMQFTIPNIDDTANYISGDTLAFIANDTVAYNNFRVDSSSFDGTNTLVKVQVDVSEGQTYTGTFIINKTRSYVNDTTVINAYNDAQSNLSFVSGYGNKLTSTATGSAIIAISGSTGTQPYTLYTNNINASGSITITGSIINNDYTAVSSSNASNIATDLLVSSSLYLVSQSNDTDIRNLTTLSSSIQDYVNVSSSLYTVSSSVYNLSTGSAPASTNYWQQGGTIISPSASITEVDVTGSFKVLNGAVLFHGTTGVTPSSGAGTKFFWVPEKAAMRAGSVSGAGTAWDDANVGTWSWAGGRSSKASSNFTFAFGDSSDATAPYCFAFGNIAIASAEQSCAIGNQVNATGYATNCFGQLATAKAYNSFVCGRYNVIEGTTTSWVSTEPLFIIGNGTGTGANAKNALTVYKNGNTTISGSVEISGSIRTNLIKVTTSCTASSNWHTIIASGSITQIHLPASITGKEFRIKNICSGSTVTIYPNGTQKIEDLTSSSLVPYESKTFVGDGTDYWVI